MRRVTLLQIGIGTVGGAVLEQTIANRDRWRRDFATEFVVGALGGRDGVVAAAAGVIRGISGVEEVRAWLGPCIGPCCYRFGEDDIDAVAAALGDGVRSVTCAGDPALDLPEAVALAAAAAGVVLVGSDGRCTACARDVDDRPRFFSHRARGDVARHGVLACLR